MHMLGSAKTCPLEARFDRSNDLPQGCTPAEPGVLPWMDIHACSLINPEPCSMRQSPSQYRRQRASHPCTWAAVAVRANTGTLIRFSGAAVRRKVGLPATVPARLANSGNVTAILSKQLYQRRGIRLWVNGGSGGKPVRIRCPSTLAPSTPPSGARYAAPTGAKAPRKA